MRRPMRSASAGNTSVSVDSSTASARPEARWPGRLDRVVSSVAPQLMDANASTAAEVSQQVLANLVEQFDADVGFLRQNIFRQSGDNDHEKA
jgi:hypothetical protein